MYEVIFVTEIDVTPVWPLISNFVLLLFRTDFAKPMIKMSAAATNASSSSSEDDDNGSCNLQGIYNKDERFVLTDYILW